MAWDKASGGRLLRRSLVAVLALALGVLVALTVAPFVEETFGTVITVLVGLVAGLAAVLALIGDTGVDIFGALGRMTNRTAKALSRSRARVVATLTAATAAVGTLLHVVLPAALVDALPFLLVGCATLAVLWYVRKPVRSGFEAASALIRSIREAGATDTMRDKLARERDRLRIAHRRSSAIGRLGSILHDSEHITRRDAHRGIIGLLDDHLIELGNAMREAHDEFQDQPGLHEAPPIQRIVLYVDDLDRCEPKQVAEVLQAVNMLQATRMFIVVVAVDPRWLGKALRRHLAQNDLPAHVGTEIGRLLGDPYDYLDKIFQVPFALPKVGNDGFVTQLADAEEMIEAAPTPIAVPGDGGRSERPPSGGTAGTERTPPESGPGIAPNPGPRTAHLVLEPHETAELDRYARHFVTPRSRKRLLNLYLLVRISNRALATPGFAEPDGAYRIAMPLLAVVAGAPALASTIFHAILEAPPSLHLTSLVENGRHEHTGETDRHDTTRCLKCDGWARIERVVEQERLEWITIAELREWVPEVARFAFRTERIWRSST
jgi:hypothetical protein